MVRACALLLILLPAFSVIAQTSDAYLDRYRKAIDLQRDGQNAEALYTFQQAIELAEGDSLQIAKCLNSMTSLADKLGEWADAVDYGRQAIRVFERANKDTLTAYAKYSLGRVYYHIGDYEGAIAEMLNALEIFKTEALRVELSAVHNILGLIYNEQSDYSVAIQHHKQALRIREGLDSSMVSLVGQSLNNLGVCYRDMEYLDSAQFYFLASLTITTALNDTASMNTDYYNLAEAEMLVGNPDKAALYMTESLRLLRSNEDERNKAFALDLYGRIQTELGNYGLAAQYLDSALRMATRGSWKDLVLDNYKHQAVLAKKQGNLDKASYFYDHYISLNKAMVSSEKLEAQKRLEVQYDVRSTEQENINLKQENEIRVLEMAAQESENDLFQSWLVASALAVVLLLLIAILLLQRARARKKQADRERDHKREMHHRLKNNLQTLSGLFAMEIVQHSDGKTTEALSRLKGQVQSMILVHNHLNIDLGEQNTNVEMNAYLDVLVQTVALGYGFDPETIPLEVEAQTMRMNAETAQSLGLIVNEAVSNSYKHGSQNRIAPEVRVTLKKERDGSIVLTVSDNGPGLASDFDLEQLESTGLKLIQSLAGELDAEIDLDSNNGLRLTLRFKPKEGHPENPGHPS